MDPNRASQLAENTVALRAAESLNSEGNRICYDPLAEHFLGFKFSLIGKSKLLRKFALWNGDRRFPGIIGYVVGRTRYLDDLLLSRIQTGIDQLVILGAGYDSRPYRYQEQMKKIRVFEVDHPATQKIKVEKLKTAFGPPPQNVQYVPVDFDKDHFGNKLLAEGFDSNLVTFYIWEGVTLFITADAVDATLQFISQNSKPDSTIVFDYIYKSVVDGSCTSIEAKKIRKFYVNTPEPLLFGIEKDSLTNFLKTRGFSLMESISHDLLKMKYFTGINENRSVSKYLELVHAKVDG